MNKSNQINFIDLFSGCGGFSEGLLQTKKYNALAHVEWDLPMVSVLRKRLHEKWNMTKEDTLKSVIHFDIQKTKELLHGKWSESSKRLYADTNHNTTILEGLHGVCEGKPIDLIIGGPPCQAYSIAGRAQDEHSMKYDYRNYLFEAFVEVVSSFSPKMFIFENVPGILSAKPGGRLVIERIYDAFNKIGYEILEPKNIKNAKIDASVYGVPQKRQRVFIIGIRKGNNRLKEIYDSIKSFEDNENIQSLRSAIGHLPKFKSVIRNEKPSYIQLDKNYIKNHEPRYQNTRDIKIFKDWVQLEMNNLSTEEKKKYYFQMTGKKSNHVKYRSLHWDKPSQTIVAHLYKDGLMFIHPDQHQSRSITIKEAALIQTFPEDFDFCTTMGNSFKMIGNAVPPLMAKKIAEAVYKFL